MVDLQVSAYETLGHSASTQDIELTSFISLESRAHDYDDVDLLDQCELTTPSAEALQEPLGLGHVEFASQLPLQPNEDTCISNFPMDSGHRSTVKRVGTYSVVTLASTTIFMLLILSFLTFLWTARHENSFWRLIIVNGWAGGAVTVSSLLLRTAVDLQAGIAVGMLAAIILETGHVLLADSAHVSRLRAGRAIPLDMVIPYLEATRYNPPRGPSGFLRVFIVLLLVVTTTLLQFTSTMLVSDLSLGILPGMPQSESLRFDFTYEWDDQSHIWSSPNQFRAAKPWQRNPPAFPTFAEFSERINVPEHVDDTGELYRAFLPFQDAASRETISRYSGKALILDARISCQRPQIQQLHIDYDVFAPYYVGTYSNTADVPGLLGSATSVPFNCPHAWIFERSSLTICQPSGYRYGEAKLMSSYEMANSGLALLRPGVMDLYRLMTAQTLLTSSLMVHWQYGLTKAKTLQGISPPPRDTEHGLTFRVCHLHRILKMST